MRQSLRQLVHIQLVFTQSGSGREKWAVSSKHSPNVTRLVNLNMPNNAGQKSGTRKRKGAANKSPQHGKTVIFSRVLQPAQSLVGQPSSLQTRVCQPSSSQSVANVNCFSSSYLDLTQLHQYAPIPRPRQPASFQSTVGQISPDHCYQSPVPVTKVTQPQSVLPNSNQLVQTMPSLAANVPATHHSCCIIPIQHQSAATFETSKPTASATPASLY